MSESFLWIIFAAVFLAIMIIDLAVVDKDAKTIDTRKAAKMVVVYIAVALAFGLLVFFELGSDLAVSYYAAYVIELSMSVDNLFVFIIIFAAFLIPSEDQHRVLFWGIMGAIFFRAAFIAAGAELLHAFDWMMYVFGAILIYTAYKTALSKSGDKPPEETLPYRLSRRINSTPELHGAKFFIRENGKRLATPMFLCLIVIELSDLMFAFDSIPAALAISTDIFIVYTSNIFAVMGLRSLYFVIKDVIGSLKFLKYGLGVILAFIGAKMFLTAADICEVSVVVSLAFIITVLAVTIVASMISTRREKKSSEYREIDGKH